MLTGVTKTRLQGNLRDFEHTIVPDIVGRGLSFVAPGVEDLKHGFHGTNA